MKKFLIPAIGLLLWSPAFGYSLPEDKTTKPPGYDLACRTLDIIKEIAKAHLVSPEKSDAVIHKYYLHKNEVGEPYCFVGTVDTTRYRRNFEEARLLEILFQSGQPRFLVAVPLDRIGEEGARWWSLDILNMPPVQFSTEPQDTDG